MAYSQSHKQESKKGGGHASAEGKKGVSQETVGSGKEHDPNNFANDPARVNEDREGNGWFAKIKLSDPAQVEGLMDKAAYDQYLGTL